MIDRAHCRRLVESPQLQLPTIRYRLVSSVLQCI